MKTKAANVNTNTKKYGARRPLCILLTLCIIICFMPQTTVANAATKGWTQEDGEWVWFDSNGNKVKNTFKQSGSNYYWLNDEGKLGKNQLVEYEGNYYYVDETGAMVTNQWREINNSDSENGFGDTIKYYFQSSGKAYKSGKKTINSNSYIFDDEGRMLYGWISKSDDGVWSMGSKDANSEAWKSCDYYALDDGTLVINNWKKISVYDGSNTTSYWFYFGPNGKKYKLSDSDEKKGYNSTEKTIGDKTYKFAADGHLVEGEVEDTSGQSTAEPAYKKGWYLTGDNEENQKKYYRGNDGTALYKNEIKSINGKKYLFGDDGSILTGLYYLEFDSTDNEKTIKTITPLDGEGDADNFTKYTTLNETPNGASESTSKSGVYYFSGPVSTAGEMATGSTTVEVDGDNYSFKFATSGSNKGKGFTGRDGNSYYVNGRKVKASSENYELFVRDTGNGNVKTLSSGGYTASQIIAGKEELSTEYTRYALISSSGTIVKSGTKRDGNDYKIPVQDYRVTKILKIEEDVQTEVWTSQIPSDAKADTGDGKISGAGGTDTSTFKCGTDVSKINPSTLFASGSVSSESTTYMFGYDINTPIDWPTTATTLNVGTYYAWAITDNSTDDNPGAESTTTATSFNVTGKDILPSDVKAKNFVTTYTGEEQEIAIDVDISKITDIQNAKITYAMTKDGVYSDYLSFTNATNGAKSVYYKITSDNYNEYIGTAKVTVKPIATSSHGGGSSKAQTVTDEQKQAEIEKAEAEKKAAEIAEVKTTTAGLDSMKARSSKTAKGNVKVVAKLSDAEKAQVAKFTELGYTVKYRFYRSTKKSSGYKAMLTGTTGTYINTAGKSGTRYYYKVQLCVYDKDGNLVAKTVLKDCKYATRIFG